jgi:hypothetical protein
VFLWGVGVWLGGVDRKTNEDVYVCICLTEMNTWNGTLTVLGGHMGP